MAEKTMTDQEVSAIDKALAAAKARQAAKSGNGTTATPKAPKAPKAEGEASTPKRPRLTDEEKTARLAKREEERNARKAAREEKRAAKLAERAANRQPAHMKKVQKAAEKLPALSQAATLLLGEVTANYTQAELSALAAHIQHFNRTKATERALNQKLEVGSTVTIVGGDPRFIGRTGTIAKAQRIRCYVTVEGQAKPVYLFTSDVQVTTAATAETAESATA